MHDVPKYSPSSTKYAWYFLSSMPKYGYAWLCNDAGCEIKLKHSNIRPILKYGIDTVPKYVYYKFKYTKIWHFL